MTDTITVELTPAEVAVIAAAFDRWTVAANAGTSEQPPEAFFLVEAKLGNALKANPAAQKAVEDLRGAKG